MFVRPIASNFWKDSCVCFSKNLPHGKYNLLIPMLRENSVSFISFAKKSLIFFFLMLTIRAISGSQQNWLETTEFPSTAYPIYTQCPSPLTFSPEWYIGCNPVNIDASLSPKASRPHLGSFLELYTLCVGFDKCKMTCISCYSIQQNKFTVSKILLHSCYSSLKPLATADLLNSFASSRMS